MKKKNQTQYMMYSIYLAVSLLLFYLGNNICYAFYTLKGSEALDYLNKIASTFSISTKINDILVGSGCAVVFFVYMHLKLKNQRNTREKEEYGSARWGTGRDISPYIDKEHFYNNIILSETERLRLTGRPADYKHDRNKNVCVIGGSGSGKTRGYAKPNILQCHSSFVITDPKGTILNEIGKSLFKNGYKILVINLKDAESVRTLSMKYNPLKYAKKELEILTLVDTLIANTSGEHNKSKDDFWEKAEKILYLALIDYIVNHTPEEDHTFSKVLEMVRECEVREDDESFKNPIDILFDDLKENGTWKKDESGEPYFIEGKNLFCVGKYDEYKLAAGKTAKSVLISCAARLSVFGISEIAGFTSKNEIDIHSIGEQKTALFIVISDTNATLNFLVSMFYTQLFNELVNLADSKYGGKLPVHVRCILDEFANIGQIPEFEKLIATIRSREISASIILQTEAQLRAVYKDNTDTIIGNCDTTIFLGGKEKGTLKFISEMLGKETIDTTTTGKSKSRDESFSTNYQRTGRELMTIDELGVMDNSLGIVMLRGERPFISPKFKLEKHPKYKETSDFSKDNLFNLEKYIKWFRSKQNNSISQNNLSNKSNEKESKKLDQIDSTPVINAIDILKKHDIIR